MEVDEKKLRPLLDTDIVMYRAAFAADAQIKQEVKANYPDISDEDLAQTLADTDYLAYALNNTRTVMEAMLERFSPQYIAYIQGPGNFREAIATLKPYKGNRDNLHKPKYYREVKDYLTDKWKAVVVEGMETDDALSIEQFKHPDKSTVIVSTDKDMWHCPGWNYNWVRCELKYQTLREANLFHTWQLMVGDTVDNIPGCWKVGPKTADKIIAECGEDLSKVMLRVHELYQKQYGDMWKEALQEVSDLLWIRREPDKGCDFLGI